jgi:hypothetical protein
MSLPWDLIQSHFDMTTVLISAGIALLIVAYSPRRMRALVIWIAQYVAFVALVFAVAVAGRQGYAMGAAFGQAHGMNELGQFSFAVAGAAIGGLLGFAAAALVLSIFFALLDIRESTRA